MNTWIKHRELTGFTHYLPTGVPGYFVKVYLTVAGDYLVTAMHEDDCAGDSVEYMGTLTLAKTLAQAWVATGAWTDYVIDADAARKALAEVNKTKHSE